MHKVFNNELTDNVLNDKTLTFGQRADAFFKRKPVYYSLLVANGIYTIAVSFLFAAFAHNGATKKHPDLALFYGGCSLLMNAPMAWFFSEKAIAVGKRIFTQKKDTSFKVFAAVSFFLALGTTAAGIQVGKESVSGLKFVTSFKVLKALAIVFYGFNNFTTRFVGSTHLLYSMLQGLKNIVRRCHPKYTPYYQFLDDIRRYGVKLNIKNEGYMKNASHLEQYATNLYNYMNAKKYRPGISVWHILKNLPTFVISVFILWSVVNLTPLWIKLTAEGVAMLSKTLAEYPAFILYAAVSNQLFYWNSGQKFMSSVYTFVGNAYKNAEKRYARYGHKKMIAIAAAGCAAIAFLGIGAIGYFSGKGYGGDAAKAINEGFGQMANELWFKYFSWVTAPFMNYYPRMAAAVAGLVVNGGAALRFILERFSAFKEDQSTMHYKASHLLNGYLDQGNFEALANSDLRGTIQMYRDNANPYRWLKFFGCGKQKQAKNSEKPSVQSAIGATY